MLDLVNIASCEEELLTIISFVKALLRIVCIGIPIVLIAMGTVDLGKAVLASDEKEIKGATGKLIKRAISAVIIFFIPTIVSLVMGLIPSNTGSQSGGKGYVQCWNEAK